MIKRILLIALTLISFNTLASDTDMYLGGWSKHFNSIDEYNETNNLFAIQHNKIVVGTFTNSFNDQTYFIGYDWNTEWKDLKFGVLSGAMHGYSKGRVYDYFYEPDSGKKFLPLALPYISYIKFPVQPTVGLLGNAFILTFKIDL